MCDRFSDEDIRSGFEGDRRDRILRTYIRNTYDYHLSEIFYTVVNEYTDWERTVLHPINTRDSTVAALSDAQFVAPLVRTGDQLGRSTAAAAAAATPASGNGGNSVAARPVKAFFYVFDYQTRDADYPQVRRLRPSGPSQRPVKRENRASAIGRGRHPMPMPMPSRRLLGGSHTRKYHARPTRTPTANYA